MQVRTYLILSRHPGSGCSWYRLAELIEQTNNEFYTVLIVLYCNVLYTVLRWLDI